MPPKKRSRNDRSYVAPAKKARNCAPCKQFKNNEAQTLLNELLRYNKK